MQLIVDSALIISWTSKSNFLKPVLEYGFGNEIYIVISANSYEMANREQCLDVYSGEYVTFKDYEEYKKFILETRERKEKRYGNNG